jgi:hypothetical protein
LGEHGDYGDALNSKEISMEPDAGHLVRKKTALKMGTKNKPNW